MAPKLFVLSAAVIFIVIAPEISSHIFWPKNSFLDKLFPHIEITAQKSHIVEKPTAKKPPTVVVEAEWVCQSTRTGEVIYVPSNPNQQQPQNSPNNYPQQQPQQQQNQPIYPQQPPPSQQFYPQQPQQQQNQPIYPQQPPPNQQFYPQQQQPQNQPIYPQQPPPSQQTYPQQPQQQQNQPIYPQPDPNENNSPNLNPGSSQTYPQQVPNNGYPPHSTPNDSLPPQPQLGQQNYPPIDSNSNYPPQPLQPDTNYPLVQNLPPVSHPTHSGPTSPPVMDSIEQSTPAPNTDGRGLIDIRMGGL